MYRWCTLNKTEALAYNWLRRQKTRGIVYQGKRSPDFSTDDGFFEVKRAYKVKTGEVKIILYPRQRELLKKYKAKILVFSEKEVEPLDIIQTEELDLKTVRNVILHDVGKEKQVFSFILEPSLIKALDELLELKPSKPSRNSAVSEAIERYLIEETPRIKRDISVAR